MRISSKRQFFALWREGVLGNRTLLWDTVEEALAYRPSVARIGFRELGKAGGGAWELAARSEARSVSDRWRAEGRTFILDGSVPNDKSTMQGEVCRTTRGLEGYLCFRNFFRVQFPDRGVCEFSGVYTNLKPGEGVTVQPLTEPGLPPMRQTLARGLHRHFSYVMTRYLLERYMDPSSRDDLDMLLEQYPDATVEFTCFSVNVGLFPRRNTIFWEVRSY